MFFYGGELLASRPTPKLEDHPLSAFRDCLLYISYPSYLQAFVYQTIFITDITKCEIRMIMSSEEKKFKLVLLSLPHGIEEKAVHQYNRSGNSKTRN
jgi:hypothetical protein